MVKFGSFIATWMLSIVSISALVLGFATITQTNREVEVEPNHFSVRWMGFTPEYSDEYPDYYVCINDLKNDTLQMYVYLFIVNQEESGYYFRVDPYESPPTGWFVGSYKHGYIDADASGGLLFSNITRSRPTSISEGVLTESIELVVGAYYDSDFSSLYSQDNLTVTFHFIDREALAWTVLYYDNFDDGATHGWGPLGSGSIFDVTRQYYRSFPRSLITTTHLGSEGGFEKTFNTSGPFAEVYLIYSIRSTLWHYDSRVDFGLTYFKPDVRPIEDIWYQFAVKLPSNTTRTLKIWVTKSQSTWDYQSVYLDDVYVIAK